MAELAVSSRPKLSPDDGTVREFIRLNVWPKYSRREESTQENGQWAINKYILPEIGDIQCDKLELHPVEAVLSRVRDGWKWNAEEEEWEEGRPRSGWSVKTARKHLHRVLRLMTRQKLIPYNYLEEIDVDETLRKEAVLTIQEVFSLWAENIDKPVGAGIFLWGLCGLSRGESLAVRSEDIGDSLLIRKQRVRSRKKQGQAKGTAKDKDRLKTKNRGREIWLSPDHAAILGRYARMRDRICANADGEPIYPTSVRKMLLTALEDSGFPPCSAQSLRSTFQTALDEIGCPRGIHQAIVGHSPKTVTDGYVVPTSDAIAHWMGKLMEHASTFVPPTVPPTAFSSSGVLIESK